MLSVDSGEAIIHMYQGGAVGYLDRSETIITFRWARKVGPGDAGKPAIIDLEASILTLKPRCLSLRASGNQMYMNKTLLQARMVKRHSLDFIIFYTLIA